MELPWCITLWQTSYLLDGYIWLHFLRSITFITVLKVVLVTSLTLKLSSEIVLDFEINSAWTFQLPTCPLLQCSDTYT